ncbi:hypothetical protein HER10_EVM0000774 [Colletotrichum scovillei]|uniref:uncharacterized protein n=1 Tax=Colletotrichum scovillei TaxID=1209932 RepID=UPI0015C32B8A|nr:uncharacterized protein HER10_EVM0000774 [Colletotrichum scovillei]KAF4779079.1 hypothetical protein HER10_EVM0000774 [Colletotrichum scovillei]
MSELRKIAAGLSPDLDIVLSTSDGFHIQDNYVKAREAFLSLWDTQCPENGNKRAIITCHWVEADSKKRSHDAVATSGDTHDSPSNKRRMMTTPELVDSKTRPRSVDVAASEEDATMAQDESRSFEQSRQKTELPPPFERGLDSSVRDSNFQGDVSTTRTSGGHINLPNDSYTQARGRCSSSSHGGDVRFGPTQAHSSHASNRGGSADHYNDGYAHQHGGRDGSCIDRGGRGNFSHMSRGGFSHAQGGHGGSRQAHNSHGHGDVDYGVGPALDPKIARSKPPFLLKITIPAQEESNIKTGATLTSLLRQDLDNARCANCGHHGHRLIDCVFPDISGTIKGCWLCNDKSHDWCECNHPLKDTLTWSAIYDVMIGDRGGKPCFRMPFSIFDMVWKLRCQSHHSTRYDGQHGPFPLSCKFVKKMLTGKIKDADGKVVKIWQTYNYSTDEGLINRRCHLMPDLRTDTYDKLLVYRDDLEKDAIAPKGWPVLRD